MCYKSLTFDNLEVFYQGKKHTKIVHFIYEEPSAIYDYKPKDLLELTVFLL